MQDKYKNNCSIFVNPKQIVITNQSTLFQYLRSIYLILTSTTQPSMSKFYIQGNISSDDDDDNQNDKNQQIDKNKKKKFDIEDDDDGYHEEKNKMQTQKQKKNALFKKLSSSTISAINIGDFDKAWDSLQQFLKQIQKAAKFVEKEGLPASFLRTLKTVSEQVNKIDGEAKKSMKNPKGFNIMKQKLKNKIIPQFKDKLQSFKDQPQEEEDESQSEEQSEQIDDEESDEEDYKKYLNSDDPLQRRKYWLKRKVEDKNSDKSESEEQKVQQKPKRKQTQPQKKQAKIFEKKREETIIASAKQAEALIGKILKQFAKLNTAEKREEYLETLNKILEKSQQYEDHQRLSFLLVDIPIRLEVIRQITKQYNETNFPRSSWLTIFSNISSIFNLLRESEDEDLLEKVATFEENSQKATLGVQEKNIYIQIKSFINSLQRELSKSFDYLQTSEQQYSERIQDYIKFTEFMYKVSKQMLFKSDLETQAAELSFKVLQNMHFMSNSFFAKIKQYSSDLSFTELSDETTLDEYVKPIFKLNKPQFTIKALLFLVYNHAVNRRDKGKDLLVLTDISQTIYSRDYQTQVIFNRALVQLGISAFYQGNAYQTQQILSHVCSTSKNRDESKENIKIILGQSRGSEKESLRLKILPYYLHLNVDLIEAIELISSMILEIPFIINEGGKITSRSFKYLSAFYEKTHYIAEPLNYRDHIYAASNELKLGNMKECFAKLSQISLWSQFDQSEEALENLRKNIRETSLKCYILANKNCFTCLSLQNLARKFQMQLKAVRRVICREINDKKILGSITADGYLKLSEKRKQKEFGIRSINKNLFVRLEDLSRNNELIFKQKHEIAGQQEEEGEKQVKPTKKLYDAITEKLRNILSRRAS